MNIENAESAKKLLVKSLIVQVVAIILPIISYIGTYALLISDSQTYQNVGIFALVVLLFVFLGLWIYRVVVAISSMSKIQQFFAAYQDSVFAEKCKLAKTLYIVSIVFDFLFPLLNIFIYIYELVIWFAVKERLNTVITSNCYADIVPQDVSKSSSSNSGCLIAIIVASAVGFILIFVMGVSAAIALPAYAKYMNKARFTEVVNIADIVKAPVTLCVDEFGIDNIEQHCVNGHEGTGWYIEQPEYYATKYVSSVEVTAINAQKNNANKGVVTITTTGNPVIFHETYTYVIKGTFNSNGQVDWHVDPNSTCLEANLCNRH